MNQMLETERLLLRAWRESDTDALAALNADPEVMRYLAGVRTREQTEDFLKRTAAHFAGHGFGWWAVELKATGECIGFLGLAVPNFESWFTPCVEVGWRLAAAQWNRGLATEGARAALRFGFEQLGLEEIVAFTVPGNLPSRRVMEKLGMTLSGEFEHPLLPEGHPLRQHLLYRLTRPE